LSFSARGIAWIVNWVVYGLRLALHRNTLGYIRCLILLFRHIRRLNILNLRLLLNLKFDYVILLLFGLLINLRLGNGWSCIAGSAALVVVVAQEYLENQDNNKFDDHKHQSKSCEPVSLF
jgi:hypothetical protein